MNRNNLQMADRRYCLHNFRTRTTELRAEIQRLRTETQVSIENNQQYFALNKDAKDLSEQTADLRNDLEDYNMARMNSFCDVVELKKEIDDLHAHNQQLESAIDQLHREKQRKEERLEQLENEFFYDEMPVENSEEKTLISTLQTQLNQIRERACSSNIQQEALSLIDQIVELESKLADEDDQDFESTAELDKDLEQCSKAIQQLQQTNLSFLSSISRTLTTNNSNSTHTLAILAEQHRKLKQDFNRLEHLDRRLINELDELRMQSNQLQEDIRKYNDVDSLKHQAERRKQQLMIDKLTMNQRRHITQMEIQTLQSQLDTLRTQLHANPTHQQIHQLEEKLQALSRIVPSEETPTDYQSIKHQVLSLIHAHNQWLIQRLQRH